MQTTITWKELVNGGNQIIKLDDRRSGFPADGDEITLNERRYKVVGMEEAVVLLTALEPPPADPANPAVDAKGKPVVAPAVAAVAASDDDHTNDHLAKRNERVERRLSDEKEHAAKHTPATKHTEPHHVVSHKKK